MRFVPVPPAADRSPANGERRDRRGANRWGDRSRSACSRF